jgi:hypothetical protein
MELMRHLRGILCLAAIVGAIYVLAPVGRGADTAETRADSSAPLPPPREYHAVGASSCAATACHGSVKPDIRAAATGSNFIRRDEYIVWSDRDPHARSLLTLENERSTQMLRKLAIKDDSGRIVDEAKYNNCRRCHGLEIQDPATKAVSYEEVSCEACHGPASDWVGKHYQVGWTPSAKLGFADTKSPRGRTNACVKCHIGADDREVNHDLIAAGHPVLKFEMAAYHDLLPKHWNDAGERAVNPKFETQLWQAGQAASADAALALLAARLERSESKTSVKHIQPVWPEFAEFDCFACHHDLQAGSWYRPRSKKPDELAAWSPWYFANAFDSNQKLDGLRSEMQTAWRANAKDVRDLIGKVASAAPAGMPETWDAAVQQYLYLCAQFRARQDAAIKTKRPWAAEKALKDRLLEVRSLLAFDQGLDSPTSDDGDARRVKVQTLLAALRAELRSEQP